MSPWTRIASMTFALPVVLLAPLRARAETDADEHAPSRAFGRAGQIVISGASQLGFEHASYGATNGPAPQPATTSFFVAPSADLFVVRGLSVGARLEYGHFAQTGDASGDSLSIGPRAGYAVPLGDHVSFWPDVDVSYSEGWISTGSRDVSVAVGVYAPVLYHPATHFFVGLGPYVTANVLSRSVTPQGISADVPTLTIYGVAFTAGGWVAP
jgi:hypothetical protein